MNNPGTFWTTLKCVALDFDGVIVDSMPTQERIWRDVAREVFGNTWLETKLIENLYDGKSRDRMFENIELTGEQRRRLREEKDRLWFAERDRVELREGVRNYMPILRAHYEIVIATTADFKYVDHVLHREKLSPYVSFIITDDDVPHGKPCPDMILKIGSRLSISNTEICLVGDTETDLEMSRRAACRFVLMTANPVAKDCLQVRDWHELIALIQSNNFSGLSASRG